MSSLSDSDYASDDNSLDNEMLYEEEPSHILRESAEELFGIDENPAAHLRDTLMKQEKLVSINGTKYIYISEDMGWVLIQSTIACKIICNILGTYAPVNFVAATAPVVEGLLSYECPPAIYGSTFSQGVVRCTFKPSRWYPDGSTSKVDFCPALPINRSYSTSQPLGMYTAKSSNCVCPTKFRKYLRNVAIPRSLKLDERGYLCKWINAVFGDNSETILWIIGDIMADFGNKRMFMFYGPANIGKTTVVNIISDFASSSIVTLDPRFVARHTRATRNFGNSLDQNTLAAIASTRLVLVGDLEVTDDSEHLNMQTVKQITGGDRGPNGEISVTMLTCVNRLFTYEFMEEFTAADRTRRVNVVPTLARRECKEDQDLRDTTNEEKLELVSLALATRYKYNRPPLTTKAVLMTLFQAKFTYALSMVCIDPAATIVENYIATRVLCHKFNISEFNMMGCLNTMGCKCVKMFLDVPVIANICLKHKAKIYRDKSKAESEREKKGKKGNSEWRRSSYYGAGSKWSSSEPEQDIMEML